MTDENKKDSMTEQKKKQIDARLEQDNQVDYQEQPAGDVYSKAKNKDAETGVENPTEESVEEAKEWVDEHNQM